MAKPSSLARELLCPLLVEIGSIARIRLAGISSRYAEIRRRGKRANLNKETTNEFSRQAVSRITRGTKRERVRNLSYGLVERDKLPRQDSNLRQGG